MFNDENQAFLKGFDMFKVKIINEDGNPTWPERFPKSKIDELKTRSGKKFYSQMMLEPIDIEEARLKPELLNYYDDEVVYNEKNYVSYLTIKDRVLVSSCCYWDPAYGDPNGDKSAAALVFKDDMGEFWFHDLLYMENEHNEKLDPATAQCRKIINFAVKNYTYQINVEINGIGKFLPDLLSRELKKQNYNLKIIEINSKKSKNIRILDTIDAPLAAGALHAHKRIKENDFIIEMQNWKYGKSDNMDDGLDALSGAISSQHFRLSNIKNHTDNLKIKKQKIYQAKANFNIDF